MLHACRVFCEQTIGFVYLNMKNLELTIITGLDHIVYL